MFCHLDKAFFVNSQKYRKHRWKHKTLSQFSNQSVTVCLYCSFNPGNAIHHAKTPVMDELCKGDGYISLDASGLSVGLPDGLMGNSEVGHLNIGAGRVLYQVKEFDLYSDLFLGTFTWRRSRI